MRHSLQRLYPPCARLFSVLIACSLYITGLQAQVYTFAQLPEYPYPVPGTVIPGPIPTPVNITTHSFAYTFSHISYMSPFGMVPTPPPPPPPPGPRPPFPAPQNSWMSDLTIHTWDDQNSTAGLAYINKATGSGTPGTIYDQGFIMFPSGVRDVEASLQQDSMGFNMFVHGTTAAWYVIVSFYNAVNANYNGTGHYVEIYRWNRPVPVGTGGLTFINRIQLSGIPWYTRISQDGHNSYGVAITWENPLPGPTSGINFVHGYMNPVIAGLSLSPVKTLTGTVGQTFPDVAFSHSGTGLKLQFVYHKVDMFGMATITEAETPFVTGPPWGAAAVAPTINDLNMLAGWFPQGINLKTRIDCPDHYGKDNWAYCYTKQPNDIFVRFMNWNPPQNGIAYTYPLTNGLLGPTAIYSNDWPVLAFDNSNPNVSAVNVGWYTQDPGNPFYSPNTGGYIDLQLDETGVINTPLDYMQLGLLFTSSNANASATPSIAYSRQNDRTDYHFPVFANSLCPSPTSQMQTKSRPWSSANFKGEPNAEPFWKQLYSGAKPVSVEDAVEESFLAYPNPFSKQVSLKVPAAFQDAEITVAIEDITGRVIQKFTDKGHAVNSHLRDLGSTLANGSYFIKLNTQQTEQTLKVQKLEVE